MTCAFLRNKTWTACGHPATCRQQGSGIPLCYQHGLAITAAGGRLTNLPPAHDRFAETRRRTIEGRNRYRNQ